ncbi:MAG: HD-GYP domain-containing protein [Xanthomonadaceae bacterium]|nr:HD-GYP domain-containing protein [Xanthomonadaceae bacterium]
MKNLTTTDHEKVCLSLVAALCARDVYTRSHCDRVCALAMDLGNALDLRAYDLETLRIASQLHDIGKIEVRDEVLLKPGPLTPEEWEEIKAHSIHGERIINESFLPNRTGVAAIVRHHHEALDGSGYPDGLSGGEISQSCRILSIVDKYDAMTSSRVYRHALSHGEAMAILQKETRTKLDPRIFAAFSTLISSSQPCFAEP